MSTTNTFRVIYVPLTNPVSSYSFPLEKGWYLIGNQLDNVVRGPVGGVLEYVPRATIAYRYSGTPPSFLYWVMDWLDYTWMPSPLPFADPGNSLIYLLAKDLPPDSTANSLTGTTRTSTVPISINSQPRLYTGQTTDFSKYETIIGSLPEEGVILARLNRWANPFGWTAHGFFQPPVYLTYEFAGGRWLPATPLLNLGETAWIFKRPVLGAPERIGSSFRFLVPTAVGQTNFVQYAEESPTAIWQDYTNFVGNGLVNQISVPAATPTSSARFYRVAVAVAYY